MKIKKCFLLVLPSMILVGCSKTINQNVDDTSITNSTNKSEDSNSTNKSEDSTSPNTGDNSDPIYNEDYNFNVIPYYRNKGLDLDLRKDKLKTNLFNIIKITKAGVSYDGLWEAFKSTDTREDGTLIDMYSNVKYATNDKRINASYKKEGDSVNREHTIPQSIFNSNAPMKSDIFHLYPTDGYVNNRRSNYPHALVKTPKFESSNGTKVGSSNTSGVSGTVCEVIDEYKGDFARTYFYFVTCYQDKMSSFKTFATFSNDSYPSLSKWAIKLYLKWSKDDPVSIKETKRNEACYKIQGNRNPFIDMPGIENLIWSE